MFLEIAADSQSDSQTQTKRIRLSARQCFGPPALLLPLPIPTSVRAAAPDLGAHS